MAANSSYVGDKAAVLVQLDLILSSSAFRNSKRYSHLLRHLVERTLDGATADPRERTLGVEVFGRPADYDNYTDPIVRIAAGEVRKRIAQYYHQPGHERELRIELPLGSYVPDFLHPSQTTEPAIAPAEPPSVVIVPVRTRPRRLLWMLTCAVLLAIALVWWRPWVRSGAFEQFWRPFLDSGSNVTICVARAPVMGAQLPGAAASRPPVIAWQDSSTSAKLMSLLELAGQRCLMVRDDKVTFGDLRHGPAILVGGFNDAWTLLLTENMRFEFRQEGPLKWILDRQNPASRIWSVDSSRTAAAGLQSKTRDYGVISRLLNSKSGRPVLTIAGIGGAGTETAGEFVASRPLLESMANRAPSDWRKKNMQVVVGTEVIDGHPGPPETLAVHVW